MEANSITSDVDGAQTETVSDPLGSNHLEGKSEDIEWLDTPDNDTTSTRCCSAKDGKQIERPNPVDRLPSNVIERILLLADPNVFASLALLNTTWRRLSDSPHLYRHHLACCLGRSPTGNTNAASRLLENGLPKLKRAFIREAKRNVFEVFLRPRRTLVKLISVSPSSSSAFPQGEAFRFTFSTSGRRLLGWSSSRIFVIDLTTDPVSVLHELKTLRKPVAATILDEKNLLAVASSTHQAYVYRLAEKRATLIQSIALGDIPRTLVFSPEGAVLAIAYDGGIEVHAVGRNVLPTERRAVRCFDVDSLSFSRDGLMLAGSSSTSQGANLVTISPPLATDLDSDAPLALSQSRMWTTQILFPDISSGYSHVALLTPSTESHSTSWVVGYYSTLKAFRLTQVDDVSSGVTYFVGPGADGQFKEPGPLTFPAARGCRWLALAFQDAGVWLYGIPDLTDQACHLSNVEHDNMTQSNTNSAPEYEQNWRHRPVNNNSERLKKAVDPPRHLVHGYPLTSMKDVATLRWVEPAEEGYLGLGVDRLVTVAPGGVSSSLGDIGQASLPVDGGRIEIFDFERSASNGRSTEITIELGEEEPTNLPEHDRKIEVEVELERKRTQINRRGGLGLSRSQTSIPTSGGSTSVSAGLNRSSFSRSSSNLDEPQETEYLQAADNPYSNSQPRSRDTLSRAATAARGNFGRFRYGGGSAARSSETRFQHPIPHESDADNWVPPPPPYTAKAEAPLPDHIRMTLLQGSGDAASGNDTRRLRRRRVSPSEPLIPGVSQISEPPMNNLNIGDLRTGISASGTSSSADTDDLRAEHDASRSRRRLSRTTRNPSPDISDSSTPTQPTVRRARTILNSLSISSSVPTMNEAGGIHSQMVDGVGMTDRLAFQPFPRDQLPSTFSPPTLTVPQATSSSLPDAALPFNSPNRSDSSHMWRQQSASNASSAQIARDSEELVSSVEYGRFSSVAVDLASFSFPDIRAAVEQHGPSIPHAGFAPLRSPRSPNESVVRQPGTASAIPSVSVGRLSLTRNDPDSDDLCRSGSTNSNGMRSRSRSQDLPRRETENNEMFGIQFGRRVGSSRSEALILSRSLPPGDSGVQVSDWGPYMAGRRKRERCIIL